MIELPKSNLPVSPWRQVSALVILLWIAIGLNLYVPSQAKTSSRETEQHAAQAQLFFDELASRSDNPVIASLAKELVERLEHKEFQHQHTVAIDLVPQGDNSLAIPAFLNKSSMATFLVDTGAGYTVITPEMAEQLDLKVDSDQPEVKITTVNGTIQAPLVTIKSIQVGDIKVSNVDAVIADIGSAGNLAGLLGMNFFQGMELTVRPDQLVIRVNQGQKAKKAVLKD